MDSGRGHNGSDNGYSFVFNYLLGYHYRCTGLYGHCNGKYNGYGNHRRNRCAHIWIDPGDLLFRKSAP